ncbi:unnamed protein product [Adineta steineri]|uniref:Uncharacterized protein n=1 Tax=Adineta steineri TaxID=433720 RepID=A0A814VPK6_9BILA|nr:unnamed protein product [Adineta steineri]CAF1191129.1 unnamed protein product [Adineta steineri]CAF3696903.1 unnamed protein product [Adineta steineri]CAF3900541.1 unnamed protein product [Adineta steineri]
MGCAIGMLSTYTEQDVEAEVATLTPRLPMAELMNGGIIKLQGANGFFNPNSLLDPSWLKGKMTVDEYREAIDYINKCTAHSCIGLSKMFSPSERPMRENIRTQAGTGAVQQINQRFPSIQFTYQLTAQNMQMDLSYSTDPAVQFASRTRGPAGHSSIVVLYIAPQ